MSNDLSFSSVFPSVSALILLPFAILGLGTTFL